MDWNLEPSPPHSVATNPTSDSGIKKVVYDCLSPELFDQLRSHHVECHQGLARLPLFLTLPQNDFRETQQYSPYNHASSK
jgi:hypothetical protein